MIYITLPYDPDWPAVAWAKEHCPSYITNNIHFSSDTYTHDSNKIDYFFSEEADAVLFALRWAAS